MAKKQKAIKKRHKILFPAFRLFPVSDYLGIDLLRLMSLADDMSFVADWMQGHKHLPRKEYAVKIDNMRASLQHRLWMAFLFELFAILENMESLHEFSEFERTLTEEGQEALNSFRRAREKDAKGYSMLEKIRNRTFHYDRGRFQGALNTLKKLYGEEMNDGFIAEIIQESPLRARTYYNFASTVRNVVVFGVKPKKELEDEMDQLLGLHKNFYKFLDAAMVAYLEMRNLRDYMNWDDAPER